VGAGGAGTEGRGPEGGGAGGLTTGRPRAIGFRADIDALAVTEETGLPFQSTIPGMMHACGHDMHAAIVAGVAAVLSTLAKKPAGNVRFLFQPAEEGGKSRPYDRFTEPGPTERGAKDMIAAGAVDGLDALVGLHLWPELPAGALGVDPRIAMGGSAYLHVRIMGSGAHGATPHLAVDPIPVAAAVIQGLQTIVSRKNNPANPFVISVCTIHGGSLAAAIPDKVEMSATVRCGDPDFLETKAREHVERMVRHTVEAAGARVQMMYSLRNPPTLNDQQLVQDFISSAADSLGAEKVVLLDKVSMTAEDFSYYGKVVPSLYIKVGVSDAAQTEPLHSQRFDPSEKAIPAAIKALVGFAYDFLR